MKDKKNVSTDAVSDCSKKSRLMLFFCSFINKLFKKKEVIDEKKNESSIDVDRPISAWESNYDFGMNDDQRKYFMFNRERHMKYKNDRDSSGCWGL